MYKILFKQTVCLALVEQDHNSAAFTLIFYYNRTFKVSSPDHFWTCSPRTHYKPDQWNAKFKRIWEIGILNKLINTDKIALGH